MRWKWERKQCYLCSEAFSTRNTRRTACGRCQSLIGLCRCQLCFCVTPRLTCRSCSEKAQGILYGGRQQKMACFEKTFYSPSETKNLIWIHDGMQSFVRAVNNNLPRYVPVAVAHDFWRILETSARFEYGICDRMLQKRPSYDDFQHMLSDVSQHAPSDLASLILQFATDGISSH